MKRYANSKYSDQSRESRSTLPSPKVTGAFQPGRARVRLQLTLHRQITVQASFPAIQITDPLQAALYRLGVTLAHPVKDLPLRNTHAEEKP